YVLSLHDALPILGHQSISDVGHSRAAITVEVGAKESQLAELRNQMLRKRRFAAVLFDDGNDFVLDELTSGLPHQFFFVVQLRIKIDVIDSGISSHTALLVSDSLQSGQRARRWMARTASGHS